MRNADANSSRPDSVCVARVLRGMNAPCTHCQEHANAVECREAQRRSSSRLRTCYRTARPSNRDCLMAMGGNLLWQSYRAGRDGAHFELVVPDSCNVTHTPVLRGHDRERPRDMRKLHIRAFGICIAATAHAPKYQWMTNRPQVQFRPSESRWSGTNRARPVSAPTLNGMRLGRYLLESDRLSYEGRTIALAPKELSTLRMLAACSPRIVAVETILSSVWGDSTRSKSSVAQCITKLRRKLRRMGASESIVIETAYGQGYRLVKTKEPSR